MEDILVIKNTILKQLVERSNEFELDFNSVDELGFSKRLEYAFRNLVKENHFSIGNSEQERLLSEIIEHFLNHGPLGELLNDPSVTEVMINGPKQVYVERNGTLELTNIVFRNEQHLLNFIDRILARCSRRISELEPYVDASLVDGSRVNVIRPPVSGIGPLLTIRKFSYRTLDINELVSLGTLDATSADFLKACVLSRLNILISGGAGAGKTTLLNALASFVPDNERIISIEETRELHLNRSHFVPLETRLPNIEGRGEITIRDLLRNVLHMRPDRIIIGEVRSSEVLDMIQAMNTGHDGSMTTLHANSSLHALDRLETLCLMSGQNIPSEVVKRQIISAVDLMVHVIRMSNGSRRVREISEITKGKEYSLNAIFSDDGEGASKLKFTGQAPAFYPRLKKMANYTCKLFERGS
jgi:pilus assembly protein CpaF